MGEITSTQEQNYWSESPEIYPIQPTLPKVKLWRLFQELASATLPRGGSVNSRVTSGFAAYWKWIWISQVAQWLKKKKIHLQCRKPRRHRFDPCVGKIPWRRAWQPSPVSIPAWTEEPAELHSPWGRKESDTTEVTEHTCVKMNLPPMIAPWVSCDFGHVIQLSFMHSSFMTFWGFFTEPGSVEALEVQTFRAHKAQ